MSLDKMFEWIVIIVISFALSGKLETHTHWIYRAQAKVIYESRASNWEILQFLRRNNLNKFSQRPHELVIF